jgi:hypothetical protein
VLKKSIARHADMHLVDPQLWGGAVRCQKSNSKDFFSILLELFQSFGLRCFRRKKTLPSRHAQHADSPPNQAIRMLRMAAQRSCICLAASASADVLF